jgi:hypothetical protein
MNNEQQNHISGKSQCVPAVFSTFGAVLLEQGVGIVEYESSVFEGDAVFPLVGTCLHRIPLVPGNNNFRITPKL